MTPEYALVGYFTTTADDRDELIEILVAAAEQMRSAPGCQVYLVNKDAEDPTRTWVYEVWDTEAQHDASLQHEGVEDLIMRARPLLVDAPVGHKLQPMGGVGL